MEFILQQVADNCTDFFNFSENKIFNDEEMYSFFHLMEDFSTLINGVAIMMLEVFLSKLDDQLYEAVKQEKRYHVQEKSRERTITTQWGEVKIARRYYKDKVTGEYVYLLDAYYYEHLYDHLGKVLSSCYARSHSRFYPVSTTSHWWSMLI